MTPFSAGSRFSRGQVALLFLLLLFPIRSTAQYYVDSSKGNNTHAGTLERPFATLERARDAIRDLKRNSGLPADGMTVWIRGGIYPLGASFTLDERDSGQERARVVYRAWGDEVVRLIGGRILPSRLARPLAAGEMAQRLIDREARARIVVMDLGAAGITEFGALAQIGHALPVVPAAMELFYNREAMPLARYPNSGSMQIGRVIDTGSVPRMRDYENVRGGVFEYTDDRHERWANIEDLWLQGTFMWGYADDMIRVDWLNPEKRQVKLATPHLYGIGTGMPYRQYVALNVLEELDMPGEWYLDRSAGRLFFWPPAPLAQSEIAVSLLEDPLVSIEGASYVTLQDLIIEFGRGIGVYLERGANNEIAGCTVRNLGTTGILMGKGARQTFPGITHDDYTGEPQSRRVGSLTAHLYHNTAWNREAGKHHDIRSCDVYNTGGGGIYLSGGDKATLEPGGSSVENCRTWNNQRRNKFLYAGINVDGVGNRVAHNEVFDSDYQGIYIHGNDHIFEYNHVHDVCKDSDDTSPWYMGRDPSDRGNIVRYNYFENIGRPDRMSMGVYLDDGTCGTVVHGNVFRHVASYGTVYSNSGSDNRISNNIFIDGFGPALHIKSMWFTWGERHIPYYWLENGVYRHRLLEEIDIRKPPYSTRYPELADWMALDADSVTYIGMRPARNVLEKNVFYNYEEVIRLDHPKIGLRVGVNFTTSADPGFVDAENQDYRLRDDAVVFEKIPGFERIPFEKIGLYRDDYRTRRDLPE